MDILEEYTNYLSSYYAEGTTRVEKDKLVYEMRAKIKELSSEDKTYLIENIGRLEKPYHDKRLEELDITTEDWEETNKIYDSIYNVPDDPNIKFENMEAEIKEFLEKRPKLGLRSQERIELLRERYQKVRKLSTEEFLKYLEISSRLEKKEIEQLLEQLDNETMDSPTNKDL